jgi:hypothetical protein
MIVRHARKLDRAPRRAMPMIDAEAARDERWSRRSRLLFIVGAATACWAVPALLVYWLAS